MNSLQPEKTNRLAILSAGKISIINSFGFFSALLIDVVVVGRFGLSQKTDALFIALTLPQLISSVSLVAINVALVPLFTKMLLAKGSSGQWKLTSNLVNLSLLLFVPVSLLGGFVSPFIVDLLGAGLNQPTKNLAIDLTHILFLMVIPLGAIEVMKATLNAMHSFAYPAATTMIKNMVIFLSILFIPSLDIRVVAIGYVIANFVLLAFLMGSLFFKGFHYQFSLNLDDKWTQEALRQMYHPLAGAVMGQGNVVVERFLASFLPFGAVSALGYARRVLRAVDNIFLGSVTTAFLPNLSAQSANSEIMKHKSTLTTSIKMLAFISFPITALIIGLSKSIVRLLFERGAFSVDDTQTMTLFLSIYVTSIPAWAIFQALQTAYYSTGDTKRPFLFRATAFVINIILDFFLFFAFKAQGLALALVLTRIVVTIISALVLHHRTKIIDLRLMSFMARIALSSFLLGAVTLVLQGQFEHLNVMPPYAYLLDMLLRAGLGSLVFGLSLLILRVQEVRNLLQQIKLPLQSS